MEKKAAMQHRAESNALCIRLFGGVSMSWNGKQIIGIGKFTESQFSYLMQAVLHYRKEGITKRELVQTLFGDRELENVSHALRTVIYNAKKKLRAAGLPESDYIIRRDGRYYWTEDIPVEEDAAKFDLLYREACEEADRSRRVELYLEACYLYAGEFLPTQAMIPWAAQEARRYRKEFCVCVEKATELLRETEDFLRMEELGIYAARIEPLSDWETVTMEALVSMGNYEEAQQLYNDTARLYMEEQGLCPSARLLELLNKLGEQFEHHYETLDNIQRALGEQDRVSGGYSCSYPIFQGIYRMMERMLARSGQSVYLMLCTIVDSKGNPMKEGVLLTELSDRLGEAICHAVRQSDVVNRYNKGQYLVLLVNTTLENCRVVQKRINYHFIVGRQRTGVQYYVNSVICPCEGRRRD